MDAGGYRGCDGIHLAVGHLLFLEHGCYGIGSLLHPFADHVVRRDGEVLVDICLVEPVDDLGGFIIHQIDLVQTFLDQELLGKLDVCAEQGLHHPFGVHVRAVGQVDYVVACLGVGVDDLECHRCAGDVFLVIDTLDVAVVALHELELRDILLIGHGDVGVQAELLGQLDV